MEYCGQWGCKDICKRHDLGRRCCCLKHVEDDWRSKSEKEGPSEEAPVARVDYKLDYRTQMSNGQRRGIFLIILGAGKGARD